MRGANLIEGIKKSSETRRKVAQTRINANVQWKRVEKYNLPWRKNMIKLTATSSACIEAVISQSCCI